MHIDGALFKLKEMMDAIASPIYFLRGRPPWSIGYYTRKKSLSKVGLMERLCKLVGRFQMVLA